MAWLHYIRVWYTFAIAQWNVRKIFAIACCLALFEAFRCNRCIDCQPDLFTVPFFTMFLPETLCVPSVSIARSFAAFLYEQTMNCKKNAATTSPIMVQLQVTRVKREHFVRPKKLQNCRRTISSQWMDCEHEMYILPCIPIQAHTLIYVCMGVCECVFEWSQRVVKCVHLFDFDFVTSLLSAFNVVRLSFTIILRVNLYTVLWFILLYYINKPIGFSRSFVRRFRRAVAGIEWL